MGRASEWCDAVLHGMPPTALPIIHQGFLRCCGLAGGKIAMGSLCSGIDGSFKLVCLLLAALTAAAGMDPTPELQHTFAFEKKPSAQRWIRTCPLLH